MIRISLVFVCLSFFASSILSAQRVGELRFAVPYQALPAQELPEAYTTYSSRVIDRYRMVSRAGMTKLGLKNTLRLRNFRELAADGHLLVTYRVDQFRTFDVKTRSKVKETKKKDGTVEKTTVYWIQGTYRFPILMEVLDPDGGLIYEAVLGSRDARIRFPVGSRTYTSSAQLNNDWRERRTRTYRDLQKKALTKHFEELNTQLRRQIDIREEKSYHYFEYPKGKKADNADLWLAHATDAKDILDAIDSNQPMLKAEMTAALIPHLDFWKEQMAAYPPDSKKTQRYHHAAAFNLATANLVLENPGVAMDFSKRLMDNVKWNKDRSKNVNKAAAALSGELPNYPDQSRHFTMRDVSRARGLSGATYGMPEPIPVTYDTIPGYVTIGDQRRAGTVIIQENRSLNLMGTPNFRFVDGNRRPVDVNIDKVNGFGFGDFDFVVEKWADNGLIGRRNFMRVMVDGPRMQYLEYYPSHRDASGDAVELLKTKDGKLISLAVANARWLNWKKAFAKVFEDCPGLSQRVAAGEFRRNVPDIADAVQAYNEGNCEVSVEEGNK
ncbi:MAG: hypothetical protein AAGA31_11285 [Bacteroidota bacterium]